jgi:two-component system heavy metal sensor histidine kinase CusS
MKSFGARLALWYAFVTTGSFAALIVIGYFLLRDHLIHGLDLLNASEFKQIQARLGSDYATIDKATMDARIRAATEFGAVLFYIDVHSKGRGTLFKSTNLRRHDIPDIKGLRTFDVTVAEIGPLRVGEFVLDPLDVMIATSTKPVDNVMEGYVEVSAALLAVMLTISVAGGFGLSWLALRPVRAIRQTAARIGSNNLTERIPTGAERDDISSLAHLLNDMFDRLEASFNQVRRFTADASHELKTPLSLIHLQAEKLLVDGGLTGAQEELVQNQLEEVARLNAIIEDLLFISRAQSQAISLKKVALDPRGFLQSFAEDARALAAHEGLAYIDSHEGDGVAVFDVRWMRQVLLNMLSNAIKVSKEGDSLRLNSVLSGRTWRVSLQDQGPGVPESMRTQIFDRFVRIESGATRQPTGTGLGLAICRSIVELHQGRIFAETPPDGRGLRVSFELPAQGATISDEFRAD